MHISPSILPPALLDLTLLRILGSSNIHLQRSTAQTARQFRCISTSSRQMHQAALAHAPPPAPYVEFAQSEGLVSDESRGRRRRSRASNGSGSLSVHSGKGIYMVPPVHDLEMRVKALEEVAVSITEPPGQSLPYSEEELMELYMDVLATPTPKRDAASDAETARISQAEEDLSIINAIDQRLLRKNNSSAEVQIETETEAFISQVEPEPSAEDFAVLGPAVQPYRRVLTRAHEIVSRVEAVKEAMAKSKNKDVDIDMFPIAVLSPKECEALVRVSVQALDPEGAELALSLMKRTNVPYTKNTVTEVIELYADAGNPNKVEHLLSAYVPSTPTSRQRHLHVKAHLLAHNKSLSPLPSPALSVLHHYESTDAPAPIATYTTVISSLFSTPSSTARAHAWDLFVHMRYVAHPDPDEVLYALMIRACANPLSPSLPSEPEKALDLWTEMTVDHRIQPSLGAYNAIILACARSGEKQYVNEAFRMAREMLDGHRDARGVSRFSPDRKTYCALLEGAKRIGDLGRVRWILAEMAKGVGVSEGQEESRVWIDEEVMMHVFHAYASYRPPFERTKTRLVNGETEKGASEQESKPTVKEVAESEPGSDIFATESSSDSIASHLPPQSKPELLAEAKFLFNQILEDTSPSALPGAKFSGVSMSTRLVNSYLSIFYRHASLYTSHELFWTIFEEANVKRSAGAYVEALERCANERRGMDRKLALKWAEEVWERWVVLERDEGEKRLSKRLVERAHVSMIRILALTDNIDRAVEHVRSFVQQFPPNAIRAPTPKPVERSTRTKLADARPLVHFTSATEVPDDNVPPLLVFRDVEPLHHRLVAHGRVKDIGYLKWVCSAYEWALRVRRDEAMKARPMKKENPALVV